MTAAALRLPTLMGVVLLGVAPSLAHAQDLGEPAVAEAPSASPHGPAEPAPPDADSRPPCRLGGHAGIDEPSAETASQVVCDALQHAGASAAEHFRVSLGRLGHVVILSVAEEGTAAGSTVDSRQLRLQGIEEVPLAAPRLAESIVHGTSLEDTQKVDNLVGEEMRRPQTKGGKTHFSLGLIGVTPPIDHSLTPSPGLVMDIHYETPNGRFELGGNVRFGGGSNNNDTTDALNGFFLFSMGGRYYTTDTDFSPYVGGGLAWSYFNLTLPDQGYQGDHSGLGAYLDAGFEVLRTHSTHLGIGARLDLPFYEMNAPQGMTSFCAGCGATTASSFYYAPLSIELRMTF